MIAEFVKIPTVKAHNSADRYFYVAAQQTPDRHIRPNGNRIIPWHPSRCLTCHAPPAWLTVEVVEGTLARFRRRCPYPLDFRGVPGKVLKSFGQNGRKSHSA
jgi:hypothetical protein